MEKLYLYSAQNPEHIKELKKMLREIGYYIPNMSENFDDRTRRSVKAFQNDNNLKMTGEINEITWKSINISYQKITAKNSETPVKTEITSKEKLKSSDTLNAEKVENKIKSSDALNTMKAEEKNTESHSIYNMPLVEGISEIKKTPPVEKQHLNFEKEFRASQNNPESFEKELRELKNNSEIIANKVPVPQKEQVEIMANRIPVSQKEELKIITNQVSVPQKEQVEIIANQVPVPQKVESTSLEQTHLLHKEQEKINHPIPQQVKNEAMDYQMPRQVHDETINHPMPQEVQKESMDYQMPQQVHDEVMNNIPHKVHDEIINQILPKKFQNEVMENSIAENNFEEHMHRNHMPLNCPNDFMNQFRMPKNYSGNLHNEIPIENIPVRPEHAAHTPSCENVRAKHEYTMHTPSCENTSARHEHIHKNSSCKNFNDGNRMKQGYSNNMPNMPKEVRVSEQNMYNGEIEADYVGEKPFYFNAEAYLKNIPEDNEKSENEN